MGKPEINGLNRLKFLFSQTDDNPKLSALKEEIRTLGLLDVKHYSSAEEMGEYLYRDLRAVIDNDFPLARVPTIFEKERNSHRQFQKHRIQIYVPK